MELSKKMAQEIVNEVMKVIPNNINVMNSKGIIIGSGDKRRIGTVHNGAIRVLKEKKMIEIIDDKKSPGVLEGVNEPIIMNNETIGVVGITGPVDEVRPISKLVRATTVLLIEQKKHLDNKRVKEKKVNEFLYELVYRKKEYDNEFYYRANEIGIDLHDKYKALVLIGYNESAIEFSICKLLSNETHFLKIDTKQFVIFFKENGELENLLSELKLNSDIEKIGIGDYESIFNNSFEQGNLTLEISTKIKPEEEICLYSNWNLLVNLNYPMKEEIVKLITLLEEHSEALDLIETLRVYIENNGEMKAIAKRLNIHRNTLTYRLDKIYEITNKNPKKFLDLLHLLLGLVWR